MVLKIKKIENILGDDVETTQYLPEGVLITRERRKRADRVDLQLQKSVGLINEEYEGLEDSIKKNELAKWKWLGGKLNDLIESTKEIERSDVDNHIIWPAVGQYLRKELQRGFNAKRSGTRKDHYRKCWLIATLPDLDWINGWSGWDAFIDRGEQLVMSKKIIPSLWRKFVGISSELKPRDYQRIAKLVTERIPLGTKTPTDIDALSNSEIEEIIESVYEDFTQK